MRWIRNAVSDWKQRTARERRQWYALLAIAGLLIPVLGVPSSAEVVGGFEIDANQTAPANALYSGNDNDAGSGNDWAQGSSDEGVFLASAGMTGTANPNDSCYGSGVDLNPDFAGVVTFLCDGHSSPKLSSLEAEKNLVSPSGKSNADEWPIKSGNVKGKNDFTHAYAVAEFGDSPCDADSTPDNLFLRLAGHRGDAEGDAFWGFEFDRIAPDNFAALENNTGETTVLDFNRTAGDLLVSFGVTSGAVNIEVFEVATTPADGEDANFVEATPTCDPDGDGGDPPLADSQDATALATNDGHDITAPPWNVPVCDPTADDSSNQCRLANGDTPAQDLLGSRLFAEASIDLFQFGITDICVSTVLFTSRASTSASADIDDVGGGDFNVCAGVSGSKFHDVNKDGDWDTATEDGLGGWTINIYSDDGDTTGTLDLNDTPLTSTVTASDGSYSFSNLQPGDYIICEVLQTDWTQSSPLSGTTGSADCSDDPFNENLGPVGHAFTLAGVGISDLDFGNFSEGTISGIKFKDVNADGTYDPDGLSSTITTDDEVGLNGWTINIYSDDGDTTGTLDANDTLVTSTVTDFLTGTMTPGVYSVDLTPGAYIVCEVAQDNWTQTAPSNTVCDAVSGLAPGGYTITVQSGVTSSDTNFGNAPLSTITVTFNDLTGFTQATSISCVDSSDNDVGSTTTGSSLTTNAVTTDQSAVTCTVVFEDP